MVEAYGDEQYKTNYRFASIVAAIYEVNRNRKKRKQAFTPEDFIGKKDKKQSTEDMIAVARNATLKLGGNRKCRK